MAAPPGGDPHPPGDHSAPPRPLGGPSLPPETRPPPPPTRVSPLTPPALTPPAAASGAAGGTAHARNPPRAAPEPTLGERLDPRHVPGPRNPKTLAGRRAGPGHDRRVRDGNSRD